MRRALEGLGAGCRVVDALLFVVVLAVVVDFFLVMVAFLPLDFFTPAFVVERGLPGPRGLPGARGAVAVAVGFVGGARAFGAALGLAAVRGLGAAGWGAEGASSMNLFGALSFTPACERVFTTMFGYRKGGVCKSKSKSCKVGIEPV